MSGPLKRLPAELGQFPSIESFQKWSQHRANQEAQVQGREAPAVYTDSLQYQNLNTEDGRYQLVYRNPELDLVVIGDVDVNHHEMAIVSEKLSDVETLSPEERQEKIQRLKLLEMEDGCSLTQGIGAAGEMSNKSCQDGVLEPALISAAKKFKGIADYQKFCEEGFRHHMQTRWGGQTRGREFSLNRALPHIPDHLNPGNFQISYDNKVNNYYCDAIVSTTDHALVVTHGEIDNPNENYQVFPLDYACKITEELKMTEVFVGNCIDYTPSERMFTGAIETTWDKTTTAFAYWTLYALGSKGVKWKFPNFYNATLARINGPAAKMASSIYNHSLGYITRPIGNGLSSMWNGSMTFIRSQGSQLYQNFQVWGNQAVRWSSLAPKLIPGAVAALRAAPLAVKFLGPTAAAAGAGGGTVAVGGGTVAAGGGTAVAGGAAAGAGTVALAVGAAAAVGVGIGYLIENTPRWLGAEKSVSDGIAWVLEKGDDLNVWAWEKVLDDREKAEEIVYRRKMAMVDAWDATLGKIFN